MLVALGHVQNQTYISTDLDIRLRNLTMVMSVVMQKELNRL